MRAAILAVAGACAIGAGSLAVVASCSIVEDLSDYPGPQRAHFVYAIGGVVQSGDGVASPSGEVLVAPMYEDGSIGAWRTTSALPAPTYGHRALVRGSTIYVIGGVVGGAVSDTVQAASIAGDGTLGAWTVLPSTLHSRRTQHSIVELLGSVAVIGGYADVPGADGGASMVLSDVELAPLDPDAGLGVWSPYSDIGIPRAEHTSSANAGRIYVAGGNVAVMDPNDDAVTRVEVGAPSAGAAPLTWSTDAKLPWDARGLASFTRADSFCVLGGVDMSMRFHGELLCAPLVASADARVGAFAIVSSFAPARSHFGAALMADTLIAAGGFVANGVPTADVQYARFDAGSLTLGAWVEATPFPAARASLAVVVY